MAKMRVIEHGEGGGPEVCRVGEADVPVPGPGELLVKVVAAGVNGPDLKQRAGGYPPPKGASPLMGLEMSGHVAGLGEGVKDWFGVEPIGTERQLGQGQPISNDPVVGGEPVQKQGIHHSGSVQVEVKVLMAGTVRPQGASS
jgi:NADPH:quinone reductase-like Zn-dependent oxidoreductase